MPAGDLRARVLALLDAGGRPREEVWQPLGPQALAILAALAADPTASTERRTQAVASLAVVAPPQGAEPLRELLDDAGVPPDVRASAASALGRCLGLEAIPLLISRLGDRDARVREAAAVALGRLGGAQARQALEDRVALEEQFLVREALQRGLTLAEP